jgi:peptide/nickel transport system substrate-binding protein
MRRARQWHNDGRPGLTARREMAGRGERRSARLAGRRVTLGCAGLVAFALAVAGCGANGHAHVANTPVDGGTATYALPANVTPNYIFPFAPGSYFTIVNLDQFQYLMYRPLYWWGQGTKPYPNPNESLAQPPQYSGQTVTIKLKPGYRWTDHTFVNAKDVIFWMNMMRAEAHHEYGGYVPGGLPDDVKDIKATGTDEVQMTIIGKYSPLWFTDNELSQITPLPLYWDRTSLNSPSDCVDVVTDCPAVFKYLNSIATASSDWVSSPIWQDVDGPWRLTSYTSAGTLTYTYNTDYSGPVPPHHITKFVEEPFTSEEAEFNVLQAGGKQPLDVGYLPTVDAPVPPPGQPVGDNPVAGYHMNPLWTWGLNYIPYNFNPIDPQVHVFDQPYFRQAFQYLVNQAAIIQGALHGYGIVSTGPVGDAPTTTYLSPQAKKGDPFPYNPTKAEDLLKSHGWDVRPAGVTTCGNPAECGAGIKAGTKLEFDMFYVTGNAWVQAAVLQLKSNAATVGIQMNLKSGSFDDVVGTVENGCGTAMTPKPCQWELADWGQGWSYQPDYLPTGDELYETNSAGNLGDFSNAKNDALIKKTVQASSNSAFLTAMYNWEAYLTPKLPVMLQPEAPSALMETIYDLHIGPQPPTLTLTPETWYFMR